MAREKYDRYSDDFKLKVLSDYFERGMSKYFIARKWGINRGLIDAWLKIWPIDPKELSLPDEIISTSRMSDKGSAKSGERRECYVPNYEVSEELANAVEETGWTEVAKALEQSRYLLDATLRGDAATVARMVQDAHIDNTSLIKYSDENSMSCVLSIAYYYAHGDYIFHREYQTGTGFADLVLMPRKNGRSSESHPSLLVDGRVVTDEGKANTSTPAIIVELKYNDTTDTAIDQIHNRHYPAKVAEYTGNNGLARGLPLLLVGISYDKKTKEHQCKIERLKMDGQ